MDITRLQPAGLVTNPAFSHVAIVPPGATTIYVGGQNGVDETGSVVSSDIAEQATRTIDNATIALVTAARVAGLGVPGALIEVSAIAAVMPA